MLYIVSGFSGSGKTVVAQMIAEATNGELLRTDVVRKQMKTAAVPLYTVEARSHVYQELTRLARAPLAAKKNVVLDGTFLLQEQRRLVEELAREFCVQLKMILVDCPEDVAAERITARAQRGTDASDASTTERALQMRNFQPFIPHATINNGRVSVDHIRAEVQTMVSSFTKEKHSPKE